LQRIGYVLHISSNGNIILKADHVPRIGDQAMEQNLKAVGTVSDIFGSVSNPYVAVRPSINDPSRLVQRVLYAVPSNRRMEKRRRRR